MPRPGGVSSSGRDFAVKLPEKIEDKVDLIHHGDFAAATGLEHGKAFAIGMQVKIKCE